jgi:hypothetical protein
LGGINLKYGLTYDNALEEFMAENNTTEAIIELGIHILSISKGYDPQLILLALKICRSEPEQDYLSQIRKDVRRLIIAHFKAGEGYLSDLEHTTNPNNRHLVIEKALGEFALAAELGPSPSAAKAHYLAGSCYDLFGEPQAAQRRYEESFRRALVWRDRVIRRAIHTTPRETALMFTLVALPFVIFNDEIRRPKLKRLVIEYHACLRSLRPILVSRKSEIPEVHFLKNEDFPLVIKDLWELYRWRQPIVDSYSWGESYPDGK